MITKGVDILTISRRTGHSKPSVTLGVYGHLMAPTDAVAADEFQAAFGHGNGTATSQERN